MGNGSDAESESNFSDTFLGINGERYDVNVQLNKFPI